MNSCCESVGEHTDRKLEKAQKNETMIFRRKISVDNNRRKGASRTNCKLWQFHHLFCHFTLSVAIQTENYCYRTQNWHTAICSVPASLNIALHLWHTAIVGTTVANRLQKIGDFQFSLQMESTEWSNGRSVRIDNSDWRSCSFYWSHSHTLLAQRKKMSTKSLIRGRNAERT